MKAISRFLSNKNTVTLLCIIVGVVVLYVGYNMRIKSAISPVSIPYARVTIQPRTLIEADMVGYMDVPPAYVKGSYISNRDLIVGKYTNYNTIVPAGSIFFRDTVIDGRDLPDSVFGDVPEGYTLVSFPVTMESTYGNSMFPGNYIDLYFKAMDDDDKLILGRLITNIKLLDVKDSSGKHVFENTEEARTPNSIIFAVPEDMHLLIRKASYLRNIVSAELIPVPNTTKLKDDVAVEVTSAQLQEFILSKTVYVTDEMLKAAETTP